MKATVFVLTSELLVCSLCLNEFSSHDIVLHTKRDVTAFPVPLFLTSRLGLEHYTKIKKFKAIKLCDFKMDSIKGARSFDWKSQV